MLISGKLNKKITIYEFIKSQGDYGEDIETKHTFATVWAAINPVSGNEYWEAGKQNAEVTTKIRIRYIKNMRPSFEIYYRKRRFKIISIINYEEKNTELHLMCKEILD